ncbi:hypothetical protein Peur_061733 [Populus x canadensis]
MVVSLHWGMYHRELFPRLVEGSWDGKTRYISTTGIHTSAITDSGEVYTSGSEEGDGRLGLGPDQGPNEGGGLTVCTAFLCHKSTIFLWGLLLCKGLFCEFAMVMDGYALKKDEIAGGGYHCLALTDEGQVLSWGFDGHGQLGHSSIQCQKIPAAI